MDLHYAAEDPNAGTGSENVGAAAYTPDGTLYGLDTTFDTLVRVDPANEGALHTVGALGFNAGDAANGFDVGSDGLPYVALGRAGTPGAPALPRGPRLRPPVACGQVPRGRHLAAAQP